MLSALARALAEAININRLPVPEPAVVNGHPLKYKDCMDFCILRPLRDETCDSHRFEVFLEGRGGVGKLLA